MLLDGERLNLLIRAAKNEVLLCAPFIKAAVLKKLLGVVESDIPVKIITRWRPEEVAAGVSDLEVFEICQSRSNTQLALLDNLHAKIYLSDENALIGSANLTATALGWVDRSNVELLMPATRSDIDIVFLLKKLEQAEPATYSIKSKIEAAAAKLQNYKLPEAQEISEVWQNRPVTSWLPQCSAPAKLYKIYLSPDKADVVQSTRDDALQDLSVFNLPNGLSAEQFTREVMDLLCRMPAMSRIIKQVPRQISDADGAALIGEMRPDLSKQDTQIQWQIVCEWIREFFNERFEVAPDKFVVRIRAPGGSSV